MHLVVLGGTGFLSGAVVDAALDRGHTVTAVTRGTRRMLATADDGALRHVVGDRDDVGSLREALAPVLARRVDAVVDCCGYTVAGARAAAEVLADVPRYVYVSSISAYRDWPPGPVPDEGAPTFGAGADLDEYGPMKAESERVLAATFGDAALAVRAGLIVGPGDRTKRLTWWLDRIAHEERVVVPAEGLDQPVAVVDARDLGGWLVDAAAADWSGAVNATGDAGMTTFGGLVEACRAAVAADGGRAAELVVVPEADLLAAGAQPWRDLPLWMPSDVAPTAWQVGTSRARRLGLPSRPVEETVLDTWRWLRDAGLEHPGLPDAVRAERFGTS
ncbi:NAD(P)H-binding protein [Actinotalea sp. AC32]|nr:NAD(P)H-binding protein [Actinotalea sp. AC32]